MSDHLLWPPPFTAAWPGLCSSVLSVLPALSARSPCRLPKDSMRSPAHPTRTRQGPAPRHAPRLPTPRLLCATPACATRLPARCLLACAMRCDSATSRDSSNLPPCATFATLRDSAPTPSVLRSRRPTRMRAISALPPVANPLSPSPPRPSPQHGCPMSPAFTHRIQTIQPALLTAQMNDMPLDLSQSNLQARRGRTRSQPTI